MHGPGAERMPCARLGGVQGVVLIFYSIARPSHELVQVAAPEDFSQLLNSGQARAGATSRLGQEPRAEGLRA